MHRSIFLAVLLRTIVSFLFLGECACGRSTLWKNVAARHNINLDNQLLSDWDNDFRDDDVVDISETDAGLEDLESDDFRKRSDDDYGHMRFGRSDAYFEGYMLKKMYDNS
ncbi:hypothetical protein CDAR_185701 [Caerostris darwini]|uniref:Uncharacterized protein n=1 Tax=Caerostris darwini TaxID=1538125 RepID=A0AAV4TC45_9ARAC|nr:hypothetical protein CDAR_185701 [Caerostris darwini]